MMCWLHQNPRTPITDNMFEKVQPGSRASSGDLVVDQEWATDLCKAAKAEGCQARSWGRAEAKPPSLKGEQNSLGTSCATRCFLGIIFKVQGHLWQDWLQHSVLGPHSQSLPVWSSQSVPLGRVTFTSIPSACFLDAFRLVFGTCNRHSTGYWSSDRVHDKPWLCCTPYKEARPASTVYDLKK